MVYDETFFFHYFEFSKCSLTHVPTCHNVSPIYENNEPSVVATLLGLVFTHFSLALSSLGFCRQDIDLQVHRWIDKLLLISDVIML